MPYTGKYPRGVLKIKKGYNPNSSSIGTVVYSFPYAVIFIGLIAAIVSANRVPVDEITEGLHRAHHY